VTGVGRTVSRADTCLIVCVGNPLVADDGVGCAIHDALRGASLPPNVRLELLGVGGIALLDLLQGERRLVLVDAVQLGGAPGTIHSFAWDGLPAAQAAPVSVHGIGLREVIELGRRLYPERMPAEVHLVGVEGACCDRLGCGLSPEVAAAVAPAVAEILRIAEGSPCEQGSRTPGSQRGEALAGAPGRAAP